MKYLVENGVSVNTLTNYNLSPLGIAKQFLDQDHKVIRYLEEAGAETLEDEDYDDDEEEEEDDDDVDSYDDDDYDGEL